jgi:ADP-heptose:LPS heptosyltransferase
VVIGLRYRALFAERNWTHWQTVADALVARGISFACIGARPTTLDLAGQACHSADYDTDATIELVQNARLYLGTDTGISHLVSTIGADMLLFRETASGSRDLTPRMRAVNRGRTDVIEHGWDNPGAVIDAALFRLGADPR